MHHPAGLMEFTTKSVEILGFLRLVSAFSKANLYSSRPKLPPLLGLGRNVAGVRVIIVEQVFADVRLKRVVLCD